MRHCTRLIVLAALLTFGSTTVADAQSRGRGPKPTTAHGPKTTVSHGGPKTTATQGGSSAARGPKTTTTRGPKAKTTPTTTTARGPKTTSKGGQKAATASTNQSRRTGQADVTTTATNLPKNPQLRDRLRTRLGLPPGTDLTPYAADFRNQGQFIAAVNVSHNLGITFTELKALMVTEGLSLGQAIQRLRPGVNADNEIRRASQLPQ